MLEGRAPIAKASDRLVRSIISQSGTPKEVLLVEDSAGDVRLMREAFRAANNTVRLHVASDGVEAIGFLKRLGSHAKAPRPDLILLDINMPKMDGREVLARLKEDPDLRMIPTIILTSSNSETDIARGYDLRANCYLAKPIQFEEFEKLITRINDFWLGTAKLPRLIVSA
jgi:chemotaxis family two-component system response regulator Rcp1